MRLEGHTSSPRYLGAASCSSSSCHGGAGEQHNQFIVWSQRAFHQAMDTDIVVAGHPRLVFELSTQTKAQPPHWRDPPDSPVRAWLTGQAVALRELSWKMQGNDRNSDPDVLAQTSALAWLLSK